MKISCSKADLLKGVNIVSKAVPSRTTMSILECILIDASADNIKLTANDMQIGIETIIDGTIEERGVVALDAKIFQEIVRKLPDEEVFISNDPSFKTVINCGTTTNNIIGKSGEDFSYIPVIQRNEPVKISQLTFKDIIRQTSFSVADNENNKVLTGELFEIKDNILKVVALDGRRVSIRNVELKNPSRDLKVIVPGKTMNEVIKVIDGGIEDDLNIFITDNHIIFEFDKTTIVSRLIDGEFFDIDKILSKDFSTKIKVNKKKLFEGIDGATVYVKEGASKPIIFSVNGNSIKLTLESFIGKYETDIEIEKEGNDLMVGFNPKFIMDALRVIDNEEITLYMMDTKSPCFIKDDEETYNYIVLPINFNAPGAI